MAAAAKVHKSALCVIPPAAATGAVQRVRHRLDKSYVRWPPHINLLYPFREEVPDNAVMANQAKQLNPSAPEFVPSSFTSDHSGFSAACMDEGLEDHITAEELEELEAAEAWVATMAMMEEAEQEHLIQVALR